MQILRGAYRVAQELQNPHSEEARGFIKEYKSGIYKKLGEWSITGTAIGVVGAATLTHYYSLPFFEFVAQQAPIIKAYLGEAFQNPQMLQIVDSITATRKNLLEKKIIGEEADERLNMNN